MLRNTVATMPAQAGYQVVTAQSAHDSTALTSAASQPIDLVLSEARDVEAVARWLDSHYHDGHRPPLVQLDGGAPLADAPTRHAVLQKPFTANELLVMVRERLRA